MDRRGNRRRDWRVPPCYLAIICCCKALWLCRCDTPPPFWPPYTIHWCCSLQNYVLPNDVMLGFICDLKKIISIPQAVFSIVCSDRVWECCSCENEKIDESGERNVFFKFYLCGFLAKLTCTLLLLFPCTICYVFLQRQTDRERTRDRGIEGSKWMP